MFDPREVTFNTWYGHLSVPESNFINFLGKPEEVYEMLNKGLPPDRTEEINELREEVLSLQDTVYDLEKEVEFLNNRIEELESDS